MIPCCQLSLISNASPVVAIFVVAPYSKIIANLCLMDLSCDVTKDDLRGRCVNSVEVLTQHLLLQDMPFYRPSTAVTETKPMGPIQPNCYCTSTVPRVTLHAVFGLPCSHLRVLLKSRMAPPTSCCAVQFFFGAPSISTTCCPTA